MKHCRLGEWLEGTAVALCGVFAVVAAATVFYGLIFLVLIGELP
jgi:hypothetical protein